MDPIWIKRYPPGVPATIDADGLGTIADYFDDAVNLYADRRAIRVAYSLSLDIWRVRRAVAP